MQNNSEKKGSIFLGFIGALIGAAVGAVVWILIGRLNYISSAVGLVTAYTSAKLYDVFGGRKGTAKVIVLVICVIIAVLVGNIGSCFWQAYDLYKEDVAQYGKLVVHRAYDVRNVGEFFLKLMDESDNKGVLIEGIVTGLLFAGVGCSGVIVADIKARKAEKAYAREAAVRQQMISNGIYGQNSGRYNMQYTDNTDNYNQ